MPNVIKSEKRTAAGAPAYQRIDADLRERINAGEWQSGAMLPSRRGLAKEYGVELMTMQRAISGLLDDGTLRADGGRGTFVARAGGLDVIADVASAFPPAGGQRYQVENRPAVVGVIVPFYPERVNPSSLKHWPVAVVHGLERMMASEAHGMVRGASHASINAKDSLQMQISDLKAAGVDGYVVVFIEEFARAEYVLSQIDPQETPIVVVSSRDIGPAASQVFYDSLEGGYQACRHLAGQGYTDLIFVSPFHEHFVHERLAGARKFVDADEVSLKLTAYIGSRNVRELSGTHQQLGKEDAAQFAGGLPGKAVIAVNDQVAYGVMEAASAIGLVAGRDYGIIGFDDEPESRGVGLSTLHPPLDAMGVEAGRIVMQALRGQSAPMQVRLRSHLIPRSSSLRAPV